MTKKFTGLLATLVFTSWAGAASAAIVEVGDLNIIRDAGNPSDGLAFLDMTYSDGRTLEAALANAQLTYPSVRVATPAEFDDLFAAAGIIYDGTLTASDAFRTGPNADVSTGSAMLEARTTLSQQLGRTDSFYTKIWSDPDGSGAIATTRDQLLLTGGRVSIYNEPFPPPPNSQVGWLLVTPVPLPAAGYLFVTALVTLFGTKRFAQKQ